MARPTPIYLCYRSFDPGATRKPRGMVYPPLALGTVASYALTYDVVKSQCVVVPRIVDGEAALRETFDEYGPGIYLFSNYVWSVNGNLALSGAAKALSPRSITIHGGPSTPKYEAACADFFARHPHVDVAVRGEGENVAAALLAHFAEHFHEPGAGVAGLGAVKGITFRGEGGPGALTRTEDAPRLKDLDAIPSPYLNGLFDAMDATGWLSAIQETNRGCPYGCTFCDWGTVTLQKIYCFSMDRVREEAAWFGRRQIRSVLLADANFGIFDRDVEIAEVWVRAHEKYGYPKQLELNYAKNATRRLSDIVRILMRGGIVAAGNVAIQTHDPATLKNINRSNIKTERYDDLISIFRSEGLPISSDLLTGLPGQTVESFERDLQFFADRRVFAAARPVTVLPNSPMADPAYAEKYGIKLDRRSTVIETASLPAASYAKVKRLNACYATFMGFGMGKYIAYWLQIDHGVPTMRFLADLESALEADPTALPNAGPLLLGGHDLLWSADLRRALLARSEAEVRAFYRELVAFAEARYGVPADSTSDAIVEAQVAVTPWAGRETAARCSVPHDVVAYFEQVRSLPHLENVRALGLRPLADFAPTEIEVRDPIGLCRAGYEVVISNPWYVEWELDSPFNAERVNTPPPPPPAKPAPATASQKALPVV